MFRHRCCIPTCVVHTGEYTGPVASFALKHPVFAKSPAEKEHRQNLMNIVTGIIDTLRGQPIEYQIYRELANICEKHFRPEDLKIFSNKQKRLKIGALPFLNMPLMTHKQRLRKKRWIPPHILTQPCAKKTKSSHSTQTDEKYDFSNCISNVDVSKEENVTFDETPHIGETIIYPQNIRGEDDLSAKRKLMSLSDSMWVLIVKLKQCCISLYTDLSEDYAEVHFDEIKSLFYEVFEIGDLYKEKQVQIFKQNLGYDEEDYTSKNEEESITNPTIEIDQETNQNETGLECDDLPDLGICNDEDAHLCGSISEDHVANISEQCDEPKTVDNCELSTAMQPESVENTCTNTNEDCSIPPPVSSHVLHEKAKEMVGKMMGVKVANIAVPVPVDIQESKKPTLNRKKQINKKKNVRQNVSKLHHKIKSDTNNKRDVKNIQDTTSANENTDEIEVALTGIPSATDSSPPPPTDDDKLQDNANTAVPVKRKVERCTEEELKYYLKQKVSHPEWGHAYKCDICGKVYKTWPKLKRHDKQTHIKKLHTKCNICNKLIMNSAFDDHLATHTQVKKFTCEKCGIQFRSRSHHHKHVKSLIACRYPNFQCKVCDEKVFTEARFEKHFTEKHIGTDGICEQCGEIYSRACILQKHHVAPLKPYKCAYCDELFTLPASLVKHMKAKHRERILEDNIWNKCPYCSKIFVLPYPLKMHIMSGHTDKGRPQFICDYCGCTGNGMPWLKKHLNVKHEAAT